MSNSADPLWRSLNELRSELDRIDDGIHDLLMARASVVEDVAALRTQGKVALRPGREAAIVRRLIGRNHGALPVAAIVRVWREILASSLTMQTDYAIAVQGEALASLAREHFGALTPIHPHATAQAALDQLRDGQVTAALLPWPGPIDPAWLQGLHVVAHLPFWQQRAEGTPAGGALVITDSAPDPSGEDVTLVAIDGAIEEVDGFLTQDDQRLAALGPAAVILGAYAAPFAKEE